MKNIPNLYALRAFLAILVIVHHIPLICKTFGVPYYNSLPIFDKGPLAVYFFFTLSGFLILRLISLELANTKTFNFKHFYLRRVQRLYPVYYLVLIIGIVLYHVVLPHLGIAYRGNYSLSTLIADYVFFVPNVFRYYYQAGSILLILWSIGVEEQFYLFMPVYLYLCRKNVLMGITVLLGVLLLILLLAPSFYKFSNFYFYFLFGGLLSVISTRKKVRLFENRVLQFIVFILVILSFTTNFFEFKSMFFSHLFNLVTTGLFVAFISDYPMFIIKNSFTDSLGKVSYGIYAYQGVVITGALFLVNKFKPYNYINHTLFIIGLNLIIIVLTVVISLLSFKYFESRFYKPSQGRSV